MSEHEANTNAVLFATKSVCHLEGGWPKDVDCSEAEHTIRFRKKIEKDEDYIRTVVCLSSVAEHLVTQNNAIDIYETYFSTPGSALEHSAEMPSAKTVTVLRDPTPAGRSASAIHWHPDASVAKAAVAYSILAFQQQPPGMPLTSHVWDLSNPTAPEAALLGASQLVTVKFNGKDGCLVGGGQYNGQFCYFDTRRGPTPVDATPADVAHRDPVFDFHWLQSKTGTEATTVSTDGHVHWWDIRKLSEQVESMPLREKGSDALLGGVCLEYDPAAGPTRFMVGTEQGVVLSANRKAKTPADRVGASFTGHHGPVYGLRRHPFSPKYFLSVGDWSARIWNEDLRTPLLVTPYAPSYVAAGTWSPSRPGVFFAGHADGMLAVWDLYYKHSEPSLKVQVTDHAVTSFAVRDNGAVVAVGAADGSCHVLQLSSGLCEPVHNEKAVINTLFERETLRERSLDAARKKGRDKARRQGTRRDALPQASLEELRQLEFEVLHSAGMLPPGVTSPSAPEVEVLGLASVLGGQGGSDGEVAADSSRHQGRAPGLGSREVTTAHAEG